MAPLFETILAKIIILTDAILEIFVNTPTFIGANGTNMAACATGQFNSNGLTACGITLVSEIGTLMVEGIGTLNGALQGLGVFPQA